VRKLVFLAAVLALLAGADLAARTAAERRLASRAARAAGPAATAAAEIGSFPFLPGLLLTGSVADVRVRVETVTAGPLVLGAVEVDLDGVRLDRSALYGGRVRLRDIDGGLVTVEVDGSLLTESLDVPVAIEDGILQVVVAGAPVTARAQVDDGTLVVSVAGRPELRLAVPRTDLSPCRAADVSLAGTRLRLTCRIDDVPAALLP